MSRQGWTGICFTLTERDGERLSTILGPVAYNAWLRELVNDWLEAHGYACLEEAQWTRGQRKACKARAEVSA